ncbi:MAG: hypothetical protein OJJ55_06670 [Rhodococcus sp.]|nr:hypothetical protein [Rhodococcus sp. (in: high G+C Gram-positive bacteria)]
MTVKAAINTTVGVTFPFPLYVDDGVYVDLAAGTTPQITAQVR